MPTLVAKASIKDRDDRIDVDVTWESKGPEVLDRKDGTGFGLPKGRMDLAKRLVRAINSGLAFENPSIAKDINGKTYVVYTMRVMGRRLNKDLTALGF